ncbi:MAG: KTSC domain-containing protein [Candidatus Nanopelagicales bacterium]
MPILNTPFDNFNRRRREQRQAEADLLDLQRHAGTPRAMRHLRSLATLLGPIGGFVREILPTAEKSTPQQLRAIAEAIRLLRPDLFPQARKTRPVQRPSFPFETDGRPERRQRPFLFRGDPDDPIYRGEWITVASSNVYAIAYVYNDANPSKGTLKVRYLHKLKGGSTEPGPVYEYYDVHPAVFDSFRAAASKGGFVWDRLRVRGTVSGHRYQYNLAGVHRSGYVPRKAVRYGNNEYFVGRQINTRNTVTGAIAKLKSELPDARVRRVQSVQMLPGGRRVPVVQR